MFTNSQANVQIHLSSSGSIVLSQTTGSVSGPLFTFGDGSASSQSFYTSSLSAALSFSGLNPKLYKLFSFRTGVATISYKNNIPEERIKKIGRCRFSAVKRYFRIQVFDGIQLDPKQYQHSCPISQVYDLIVGLWGSQ